MDKTEKPLESKKPKEGDIILFKRNIMQAPNEDTPEFILAKRNERGVIVRASSWHKNEWLVQPNGHNAFYAFESEFEIL